MKILSIPLCFRSLVIYSQLFEDAHRDAKILEEYLCQVEAWEGYSREHALEFVWSNRDSFKKMCDTCYGQKEM